MSDLRTELEAARLRSVAGEKEAAEQYRLMQAKSLLSDAGYVEHEDGTWHPSEQPHSDGE